MFIYFSGWTALQYASLNGHKNIFDVLVTKNADINLKDDKGRTSLMIASSYGHSDIVKKLIELKANPKLRASSGVYEGKTACSQAIFQNVVDVVKYFKENGYESTCYGKLFQSLLDDYLCNLTVFKFFLQGCRNDETIVEKAMENDLQSVEELIQAGVCVDSKVLVFDTIFSKVPYSRNYYPRVLFF